MPHTNPPRSLSTQNFGGGVGKVHYISVLLRRQLRHPTSAKNRNTIQEHVGNNKRNNGGEGAATRMWEMGRAGKSRQQEKGWLERGSYCGPSLSLCSLRFFCPLCSLPFAPLRTRFAPHTFRSAHAPLRTRSAPHTLRSFGGLRPPHSHT